GSWYKGTRWGAWSFARVKRLQRLPVPTAEAVFADGVTVRWSFYAAKDKPFDWESIMSAVCRSYCFQAVPYQVVGPKPRQRHHDTLTASVAAHEKAMNRVKVPAIVSLREITTGETHIGGYSIAAE